jgi:hypothetical protein
LADQSCTSALRDLHDGAMLHNIPAGSPVYFGGAHVILAGDCRQHRPIKALPLYSAFQQTQQAVENAHYFCDLLTAATAVRELTRTFRQDASNPNSAELLRLCRVFDGTRKTEAHMNADVEWAVQQLNNRAVHRIEIPSDPNQDVQVRAAV